MGDKRNEPEVGPGRDKFANAMTALATFLIALSLGDHLIIPDMGNPILLEPDEVVAFKRIDSDSLLAHGYLPTGWQAGATYPAVIFFREADSEDILFDGYSRYLAMRGAVAVVAQYRTGASHDATPRDSVADGQDAIRWVRAHAGRLGIDPNRIAAGGYGSDGYVAAVASLGAGSDRDAEISAVDSAPNALLLYSTVLTKLSGRREDSDEWKSPLSMVTDASPPTFVVHRTSGAGRRVAIRRFCNEMGALGNICEGVGIDQRNRNYMQFRRREYTSYFDVLRRTDRFLTSLGFLEGDPLVRPRDSELLGSWEMIDFLIARYAPWGSDRRSPSSWESLPHDATDSAGQG